MGAALVGLQVAGAGINAYGAYQQGIAQKNYYDYLAGNARTEEGLVTQQAQQETTLAQNEGAYQSKMLNRKVSEISGTQAATAGANVGSGSVTSQNIATDTFNKAQMDQLAIKYNADVKSWQVQNEAKLKNWQLENEARADEAAGNNAKKAGKLGAFNSILGGSTQVASTLLKSAPYSGGQ